MNDRPTDFSVNEQNLRLFWQYIAKRHSIYKKRLKKEKPPWTDDKILQQFKFTNVFRDLDPGTLFVIDEILPKCNNTSDALFNIIIYRLFNKIQTFKAAGIQHVEGFDAAEFEKIIRKLKDEGIKVFTNAFIVSGYASIKGKDKIEKVCNIISVVDNKIKTASKNIETKKDSQYTFDAIKSFNGIGNFLAYQICVDLGYHDKRLYDESEHVVAGPGCVNGLKRIFNRRFDSVQAIRYLEGIQNDGFKGIGVDVSSLFSDRKAGHQKLNLMALENCLCEFSKYMKALSNEGRPRNKYRTKIQIRY